MIIGPDIIYECPNCTNLLKSGSYESWNYFGAIGYSDGNVSVPHLGEIPSITKCKKCDAIFWLGKAKEIGSFYDTELFSVIKIPRLTTDNDDNVNNHSSAKPEWGNADDVEFLTIDEYFNALELKVVESKEEEIYIRQSIWWAYNDRVRNEDSRFNFNREINDLKMRSNYLSSNSQEMTQDQMFLSVNDKDRWTKNAERLLEILDDNDADQKVMMAELHRNLGNFKLCMEIIESIESDNISKVKEAFKKECDKMNKMVFQIP